VTCKVPVNGSEIKQFHGTCLKRSKVNPMSSRGPSVYICRKGKEFVASMFFCDCGFEGKN